MSTSIAPPGMEEFLVREDEALKAMLKGLQVSDGDQNPRKVGVWFGHPDPEIRNQSYPYLTIDLLDVDEDRERVFNCYGEMAYSHPGFPASNDSMVVKTMVPTPMTLTYQIASWARQPRHDRSIIAQMNGANYLHPRYAQVGANDDSSRRVVLLDFAKRDTVEGGKRLFRNVWTVAVKSEFFYAPLDLIDRAASSNIEIKANDLVDASFVISA